MPVEPFADNALWQEALVPPYRCDSSRVCPARHQPERQMAHAVVNKIYITADHSDRHKKNAEEDVLMTEPLVSVVMGTYNHAGFVAEAIASVLMQDFMDFEFLIADDGSTDRTA